MVAAARTYPDQRDGVRLLVVDGAAVSERRFAELPTLLSAGDLLVVNDAATVPGALRGQDGSGHAVEVRLAARRPDGAFHAVLFGAGDWRQRTEDRPPAPPLSAGARLVFSGLEAVVEDILLADPAGRPRLLKLRFCREGDALWGALYRAGRPVQYSHLAHELPLWAVQTVYAGRPWAFEMPSAGRPLTWEVLLGLRRRGVALAPVTHAAGLSAIGDEALDRKLPLPERFEVPQATVDAVARARRVIAVGTTVVRALEGAAADGTLRAGTGETDLRLGPGHELRVVDGLLSGIHAPGESHFALLEAFAPRAVLDRAWAYASRAGFRSHELGDSVLVLSAAPRARYEARPR